MRVLLVEDDSVLGDGVAAGLRRAGIAADWTERGEHGEAMLAAQAYDVVILDIALPGISGLELLTRWRARGEDVPVLLLTARDTVRDRIRGLDSGADDYLVKPFDLDELLARVRALGRRQPLRASATLVHGNVELDPASHRCSVAGRPVALSPREFAVLHALMSKAGRALSRRDLEQALYAWGDEVESNAIEVHIHHLRRKLPPDFIRTLRGVGYIVDGVS
jgi:two-component system response regulator QseB